MLGLIALLITFILPGFFLSKYVGESKGLDRLFLSILLSTAFLIVGIYFISFLIAIPEYFIFLLFGFLIVLTYINRNDFLNFIPAVYDDLKSVRPNVFLIILVIFLILLMIVSFPPLLNLSDPLYDTLSYHLPIIEDFSSDGILTKFSHETNVYEIRVNRWPAGIEIFTGFVGLSSSTSLWKLMPFYLFLNALLAIYLFAKNFGNNPILPVLLFSLSPFVNIFTGSFYNDISVVFFFILSALLLFNYLKSKNTWSLIIAGIIGGGLFLIKFTGIIFFLSLVVFLIYKKSSLKDISIFSISGLAIVLPYVVNFFTQPPISSTNLLGYFGILVDSSQIIVLVLMNLYTIFSYILLKFFLGHFLILVLALSFFAIYKRKKLSGLVSLCLISLILLISFFLFSADTPISDFIDRFFLPIYALMCVLATLAINFIKINVNVRKTLGVILIMYLLVYFFVPIKFDRSVHTWTEKSPDIWPNYLYKYALDEKYDSIFFANAVNPIIYKLEDKKITDYSSYSDYSIDPCTFLNKHSVDLVVFFNSGNILNLSNDKSFLQKLLNTINNNECGEKLYDKPPWIKIYSVAT